MSKEIVKKILLNFYENHKDFDDRNPIHIAEAERLLKELKQHYGPQVLIEAIEELRDENERLVIEARKKFYELIDRR